MRSIFVTGGTGFLGAYLVPLLAKTFDEVNLLVRQESVAKAKKKFGSLPNVTIVVGDLSFPFVVVSDDELSRLQGTVTDLLHVGALYDLQAHLAECYSANVVGTQNMIDFANRLPKLKHFHHVSTIAIAGDFHGIFQERMFNVGQNFPNPYALTKYRAEGLVGAWNTSIRRYVYRLGILVGDTTTGFIPKIDGPYYLMQALALHRTLVHAMGVTGRLPLPINPQTELFFLPVDFAASSLAQMVDQPKPIQESYRTYHLVGNPVGVSIFIDDLLERFGFGTHVVSLPAKLIPDSLIGRLGIPPETVFYMNSLFRFDDRQLRADFPDIKAPAFRDYAETIFRYAKEKLLTKGALS